MRAHAKSHFVRGRFLVSSPRFSEEEETMRKRWTSMSVGALAAVLGGCGAMVNGPSQHVKISTIPPGALLTIDGHETANPAHLDLERERDHAVTAEMPGFEPASAEINSYPDNSVIAYNCLFFLCLPQIWEGGTPVQYRLDPDEIEITLNPVGWSPR
jgi:PEGA domain-containing protein